MINVIKKMFKYPRLTLKYPSETSNSSCFVGKPSIDKNKCTVCKECITRCPTSAIVIEGEDSDKNIGINLDECIFCSLCNEVCKSGAIKMTNEFEISQKSRSELRKSPIIIQDRDVLDISYEIVIDEVKNKAKKALWS